ncbi:MAG: glycosyltransferase family 39 protein [Chloroflexi bacterium]|nr:glycosyltransferase family 39 protein [Chloroflexota bacterium]
MTAPAHPAHRPHRRYTLALALITALAVAFRLWFWAWQAPAGAVQPGDPEEYYRAALHILQGGYHDTGKWLRPPLYPAFLALMFALAGVDVRWALLGQAVLTGVGVLAFAWFARRLFASRAAGLISAAIAASFVPLASFGSVLFAEALFVVLIMLALTLLDGAITTGGWRRALLAGGALALAALTRAVALLFVPIAALLVLFLATRPPRAGPAARLGPPLALILGATLVIGPWTLRNYLVHDRLILVDTNGGISMWYGTVRSEEDRRAGEAAIFSLPNLADRQALAVRMTVERMREDPALFLNRVRFKLASLFLLQSRSFAVGDVVTISPRDEQIALSAGENPRPLSLLADLQYVLIMLGGIAGLCFAPAWHRATPTVAWFAFGVALSAITVAHHRLRLPLVGVLVPFCAYTLWRLPAALRALRRGPGRTALLRAGVMLLGWLLFFSLIVSMRYVTWAHAERSAVAGRQALARGDLAAAEAAFRAARDADPANSLRPIALGDLAFARGDLPAAAGWFAEASALEPRSLYALAMEGWLATLRGDAAGAAAAQARIASFGRDTNDFYWWAWNATPTAAPTRLVPGDATAIGHFLGFAPASFDLPAGRWTLGTAWLRLGGCGEARLLLRGPAGRPVSLRAAGQERTLTLSGADQWVALPSDAQACDPARPLVVSIQSPTGLLDLERAPWYTGVAVLAAERGP